MQAAIEPISYHRGQASVALILGDDAVGRGRVARQAASAGWRLAGHVGIAQAVARLEAQATIDLVIADVAGADPAARDVLLDRIGADVAAGYYRALLLLDLAAVDRLGQLSGLDGVRCLVAPLPSELGEALDAFAAVRGPAVGEEREEALRRRLAALGEEIARVARALATPAVRADSGPGVVAGPAAEQAFLRGQIRMRRQRDRFFDRTLFADPAWDILLDLRLAAIERRSVAVSSLCIAAAVPPTTGLRWITLMTERGLLERVADPDDGRRVFVTLSDDATRAMQSYAAAAIEGGGA